MKFNFANSVIAFAVLSTVTIVACKKNTSPGEDATSQQKVQQPKGLQNNMRIRCSITPEVYWPQIKDCTAACVNCGSVVTVTAAVRAGLHGLADGGPVGIKAYFAGPDDLKIAESLQLDQVQVSRLVSGDLTMVEIVNEQAHKTLYLFGAPGSDILNSPEYVKPIQD